MPAPRPPIDDLRRAFERLATPDKAAFVLEATFDTIGQAIAETGRRVSTAVRDLDLDAIFRDPMRPADPVDADEAHDDDDRAMDPEAPTAESHAAETPRPRSRKPRRGPDED